MNFVEVDGAHGEGGGQILRTSLALSILYQRPVHLFNLRSARSKPGLQPQHLAAVKIAGEICAAQISDIGLGSKELTFVPGKVRSHYYQTDILTAGSSTLVFQTIALPLMLMGEKKSVVEITGGTHVPNSPIFDYLSEIWAHTLQIFGFKLKFTMEKPGFYPRGGGKITATFYPSKKIISGNYMSKGELKAIKGIACVSNLDASIASRMKHEALRKLEPICRNTKITIREIAALEPGAYIFLFTENEHIRIGTSQLGYKGKRAEIVAKEAVEDLLHTQELAGAIDRHLSDQMILPLVFAEHPSKLSTTEITKHLLTNAAVINCFKSGAVEIVGNCGQPGIILITP